MSDFQYVVLAIFILLMIFGQDIIQILLAKTTPFVVDTASLTIM